MNLDEALNTFFIESRELLEQMEEALLQIEHCPSDPDLIAAIFRAAHTIKGSAGLFGLDEVVEFTQVAESVLDKVRSGLLGVDSELVALFLAVGDHLGLLIERIAENQQEEADTRVLTDQLTERMRSYLEEPAGVPVSAPSPVVPVDAGEADTDGVLGGNWHISLRFGPEVLRDGLDPLAFIRYLGTFGHIERVVTLTDKVPPLDEIDPETSCLGYEINFHCDADRSAIEGAFDFVRNDAHICILAPHCQLSDYRDLIQGSSEEASYLGEILVRCGSLTQEELDAVLRPSAEFASGRPAAGEPPAERLPTAAKAPDGAADRQPGKERRNAEAGLIRVNAEKLDQHINLIGELIIASAGIGVAAQHQRLPQLLEAASLLARLVEEIRDSALQLRMVSIGATFNKFQRVVRDVSKELGKDIRLEISGAETELDKTVVEKIGDPLTHLVRNSMDHGIEPVEVRLARGKPAHGTVRLNAFHDSGSIVIEVSDDGGGLDRDRILAKALDRGVVKPDQILTDDEVYNLIFEAGLSTAEKVNNLSGRGVGMDVVRRNITALRGTVDIVSEPGVGTTMQVRLPLTLAIIDGFLVGVGASSFVLPLEMVVECVELGPDDPAATRGQDYLNLRGEVLPLVRLKELFEISDPVPATDADDEDEVVPDSGGLAAVVAESEELAFLLQPVQRTNVVVVQYAGRRAGLVVENLMGEFQTVIRPLGLVFNGLQGIAGFTILGNGHVALILDVPGLVRRVTSSDRQRHAQCMAATAE